MRPLHLRLIVARPKEDDAVALREALQRAGHLVVDHDETVLPPGASPQPDFVVTDAAAMPTPESLEGMERRHITAMLRFTHGNKRHAALLLGIARSTLLAKMRKYNL